MKKVISILFICVICITAIPTTAFADEIIIDNTTLGTITDADGNVVETLTIPRTVPTNGKYVDSIYTIPAGGSLTTYQYKPEKYIEFGFGYYADDEKTVVTTRNGEILLELYRSSSIGGTRERVRGYTFSTNYEEIVPDPDDFYKYHSWAFVNEEIGMFSDLTKPYYNGKYTNQSDFAISLRILIWMDH